MSQTQRYREQIDACRPGSDDLSLPALADLARAAESDRAVAEELARSQRFDRAVSAAMHDVPLPAGLLDRLEARLALGDSATLEDDDAAPLRDVAAKATTVEAPAAEVDANHVAQLAGGQERRVSRRGLWMALASLAAVALVAVGAVMMSQSPRHVTKNELADSAMQWTGSVNSQNWKSGSVPTAYPIPAGMQATGWQPFTTPEGQKGVVYNLTRAPRPDARLFVIKSHHKYDVATIPFTELPGSSQNLAIAAWHKNGHLYVVVVSEEGGQKLEDFIRRTNVTWAGSARAVRSS